MSEIQKTLDDGQIFIETTKILREIHEWKINKIFEANDLNKYFHYKDKKLREF